MSFKYTVYEVKCALWDLQIPFFLFFKKFFKMPIIQMFMYICGWIIIIYFLLPTLKYAGTKKVVATTSIWLTNMLLEGKIALSILNFLFFDIIECSAFTGVSNYKAHISAWRFR